jgi:hypothetical protein
LTWYNKFEAIGKAEPNQSNLQVVAVEAFKALGVSGGGGWARGDMRLEKSCIPIVFYPKGNTLPVGDGLVVGEKSPGGQATFFDMLLATKQIQLGWHTK